MAIFHPSLFHPSLAYHSSHAFPKQRRTAPTCLALLLIAAISGCGSLDAQRQKEAQLVAAEKTMNQEQIFVSEGEIPYPNRLLGKLDYSVPFTPDAIEVALVNDKLRQTAIQRYGDEVDAIANVHIEMDETATHVNVAADAVRVIGACTFCRHKGADSASGQASASHPNNTP